MSLPIVDASRIRALVGFEDLIEPVSRAFQDFSAGLAQSAMVTMFLLPIPLWVTCTSKPVASGDTLITS